jgi:hypothetical protein
VPADLPAGLGVGDGEAPACLAVDDYVAPGPAAKTGLLRRGAATPTADGGAVRLDLVAARDTTWDGAETRTAPAG